MCGIFGAWLNEPLDEDYVGRFTVATQSLSHRGPDDQGCYVERANGLFLGHRRLSIIDLSDAASQPMEIDGNVIAFNGEIYNFLELRLELELNGHQFRTQSDTEVLLRAFNHWGNDAFRRLDGMFSLVIRHDEGLTFATDPFGEKPLFIFRSSQGLYFTSEPTPLVKLLALEFEPTDLQIAEFLNFGFMLNGETGFQGLKAVGPATVLTFKRPNATPSEGRYWAPPLVSETTNEPSAKDVDELHSILLESIKRRLRADVPIGLFLSAGVDSSLIAAICAKDLNHDIQTFTVAFPDGLNEAETAAKIASHLGTHHRTIEVAADPFGGDFPNALTSIYGTANDNLTAISVFQLSMSARPFIKVALSGTGGDELAIGYNKYAFIHKRRHEYKIPPHIARLVASFFEAISMLDKANSIRAFLGGTDAQRVSALKNGLASLKLGKTSTLLDLPPNLTQSKSWLNKMRSFDLEATLPASYISAVDRGSMRTGLEVRCPYLNTALFDFVARFGGSVLIGKGQKYLLRTILGRYIPSEFVSRPKTGFVRPLSNWTKTLEKPLEHRLLDEPFYPNAENHNDGMIALRIAILQSMTAS